MADPGAAREASGVQKLLLEVAPKLLASLGTAAGFLGFVAFTGAAIMWARFHAARLPADQAVAAIPQRELLTVGAAALALFSIIGLLAVALAYVIDRHGTPSTPTRLALALLVGAGTLAAVSLADPTLGNEQVAVVVTVVAVVIHGIIVRFLSYRVAPRAKREPETHSGAPEGEEHKTPLALVVAVLVFLLEQRKSERVLPARRAPPERQLTTVGYAAAAINAAVAAAALLFCFRREWWVATCFVLAVFLYIACLAVARATGPAFRWYGAAIFASVAVFGGTLNTLRYIDKENFQVQPAAALRTGEAEPVCGVYVTETDNRLYLARLDPDGSPDRGRNAHLFWIAKSDLTGWTIGPLQNRKSARNAVTHLRSEVLGARHIRTTRIQETTRDAKGPRITTKTTVTHIPRPEKSGTRTCRVDASWEHRENARWAR